MINVIVIENEKPHQDYILELLRNHFPEINIQAVCATVSDGVDAIRELRPHLIFLDIGLPPFTGFDLLEQTNDQEYDVVFTTSYNEYAKKAIKFYALDYIDKPFGVPELKEAVERFKRKHSREDIRVKLDALINYHSLHVNPNSCIGLPVKGGYVFKPAEQIVRCQSTNNYSVIYFLQEESLIVTRTLKMVEELLERFSFYRVHDSHLINFNYMKSYMKGGEGGVVLMTDGTEIDVARRRKEGFLAALKERGMLI